VNECKPLIMGLSAEELDKRMAEKKRERLLAEAAAAEAIEAAEGARDEEREEAQEGGEGERAAAAEGGAGGGVVARRRGRGRGGVAGHPEAAAAVTWAGAGRGPPRSTASRASRSIAPR